MRILILKSSSTFYCWLPFVKGIGSSRAPTVTCVLLVVGVMVVYMVYRNVYKIENLKKFSVERIGL